MEVGCIGAMSTRWNEALMGVKGRVNVDQRESGMQNLPRIFSSVQKEGQGEKRGRDHRLPATINVV